MATEHDLRRQLTRYLSAEITFNDLMTWVWAVTWEVSYATRTALNVMLETVQLIHQDLHAGLIDEDETYRRIANLLECSQTSPGSLWPPGSLPIDGLAPETSP